MDTSRPASHPALRAERKLVLLALCGMIAMSWAYLVRQDWAMRHMDAAGMTMPGMDAWGASELLLAFLMWAVMMVAMMLPAAMPMVMLFITVSANRRGQQASAARTGLFVSGYLAVWTGFSALAALSQWHLHAASLLSPVLLKTTPVLGGALLIVAGVYQWTPLKHACLARCRSPLGFLINHWRDGRSGAFLMGLRHGLYCLGCCWLLMALLFVSGVMNLAWIAALSLLVLFEKAVPGGAWIARGAGLAFVAWGSWLLYPNGHFAYGT